MRRLASSGNAGAVDLAQLRSEAAAAGVAAIDHPLGPQLAHGHFGDASGRIAAGQIDQDVFLRADGPNAQLPSAAGVAGNEFHRRMAAGQHDQIVGGRFAGALVVVQS